MRTYRPIKSRCIVLRYYSASLFDPLISHNHDLVCPFFRSSGSRTASVNEVLCNTLTALGLCIQPGYCLDYVLEDRGILFRLPTVERDYILFESSSLHMETKQPSIQRALRSLSLALRWHSREAEMSSQPGHEVKNVWRRTSTMAAFCNSKLVRWMSDLEWHDVRLKI